MDYSKIINRAASIVWNHKFLMILGFLAALGGGNNFNFNFDGNNGNQGLDPGQFPGGGEFPFNGTFPGFEMEPRTTALAVVFPCLLLLLGLLIFVVSNVARGGLISAVDTIEDGGHSSFAQAWRAGWERLWTLLGIGILPAIPFFIFLLMGLAGFMGMMSFRAVNAPAAPLGLPLAGVFGALTCLLIPIALILGLLRTFANRAAMLEGYGAWKAYGRGLSVLVENPGEAFVLFLLQVAITIGLAILFFLPGIVAALCCFLWPLIILFQGAVAAFFSSLWTLAWRRWTDEGKVVANVETVI